MRVLVVVAHKASGKGKSLTDRYVKQIRAAFAACTHFQERLDIVVRTHNQLSEFVPQAAGETDVPDIVQVRDRLTSLDGVDFVFIDGDDNLLPWSRPAAPLLQLLHLCIASGKVVFGCGCTVALISYLASVGPVPVLVQNGGGKGGTLRSFGSEAASSRASSACSSRHEAYACGGGCGGGAGSSSSASIGYTSNGGVGAPDPRTTAALLLEKQTGDLFRHDAQRNAWMPIGNVGVHCSLGAMAGRSDGAVGTGLNRSDGIGPCELTQAARFHDLFNGVWPAKLIVPESNEWHCHLPPFDASIQVPTGIFEVNVLATSRLGAQVIECRNAIGVQFRPEDRFPQTMRMLHNFVSSKLALLIGEGQGEPPRRLLEMAQRETAHSDLVQQLLRSLAPPTTGPFAAGPRPPMYKAPGCARSGSASTGQLAAAPSHARPGSATSAASAPAMGLTPRRSASAQALAAVARPGSARSDASRAASSVKGGEAPSAAAPRAASAAAYCIRPQAALTYVNASRDALKTHAEQVHVGRTTKAFVEMPGLPADVPLYATRPPRASSASAVNSMRGGGGGGGGAGGMQQNVRSAAANTELVPRVYADDLVLEAVDGDDPAARAPTPIEVTAAKAQIAAAAARPRTVRVRRPSGRPFSNYQKYDAMASALRGHSVHVTSVGPYISKLEQKNLDEQDARAKSIHRTAFKPGGLWDKWEPPPGGWGFAAAGFMLPDDLPATSKRFGSFYNANAHQFRYTDPKKNLYM